MSAKNIILRDLDERLIEAKHVVLIKEIILLYTVPLRD